MDVIFDMKTLLAGNAALSLLAALLLMFYKLNQKTYSGYGFWLTGTFFIALTYLLISLSNILPLWFAGFIHGLIVFTIVLRLDGISRFTGGFRIAHRYYWLPVIYTAVVFYFTAVADSALFRNVLMGIFAFVIMTMTSVKLFKNTSLENRNLYITMGGIYFLYGVMLLGRSIAWLFYPQTTVLPSGRIEEIYFFLIMIFEISLSIFVLMINSQRLESDLLVARDKLQETVDKLQEAKTEIKTLSGLLPICASCKRIKDDQGHWSAIESYIRRRSEVEFTHDLCPDCMKKLYPQEYEAIYAAKNNEE